MRALSSVSIIERMTFCFLPSLMEREVLLPKLNHAADDVGVSRRMPIPQLFGLALCETEYLSPLNDG
jgi:hypothetical protein